MKTSLWDVCPEIPYPSKEDPSLQLTQLALSGYARLAADGLLRNENRGRTRMVIQNSIEQLDESVRKDGPANRRRSVEALLEVALNFLGMERKRAGFSDEETDQVLDALKKILRKWESEDEGESSREVIEQMLSRMKMVLSGRGMVAELAEEIEGSLVKGDLANSFIESAGNAIRGNVYYRIVDRGLSKFGNDSATGLRWARHLGAVQVSSNPVIAARAYDEIPDLWDGFRSLVSLHPEWQREPDKFEDEIALYGTANSLLPNILDFRPIALLSDFEDGMVSIQLNPLKANSADQSVKDALKFRSILQDVLKPYDAHLGSSDHRGRPNIVFKVSTCGIEAPALTQRLDSGGIGTNNTVTFSVSQEIEMALDAMKGLATALKAGIPISTIYITNMEGRLEDHLRETQGAHLLRAALEKTRDKDLEIVSLATAIGALDDAKKAGGSFDQAIKVLCSKKYLKSLLDGWFLKVAGTDKGSLLAEMEGDIRMSGIYVTRRVFRLLFEPSVRPRLVKYIGEEFDLSEAEASKIVDSVDLLPASKRRAEDTYLVLGDRNVSNLTNTEFPDHQLKVLEKSREPGFNLDDFMGSICAEPDARVLQRLLQIEDFRRAYELNAHLVGELARIGIQVPAESGGLELEQWPSYGPVIKTMDEFNNAYLSFRSRLVSFVKSASLEREAAAAQPRAA